MLAMNKHMTLMRWLLPVSVIAVLAGYLGAWMDHPVAGLAILGLDLGEYVKFLTPVRSGTLSLWREGFYLPLVAVSLTSSLFAFRLEFSFGWLVRALLLTLAMMAAFNLLPPAWTPQRMLTPEFQQQALALILCLAAVAFSPWLALLPRAIAVILVAVLCLPALVIPIWQFVQVLPAIAALYNQTVTPGWGLFVMGAGFLGILGATALLALTAPGWQAPIAPLPAAYERKTP